MDEIFHWNSKAEVTVIEGSSYLCLLPPVKLPKDFLLASLPIYQGNKLSLHHSLVILCSPFQIFYVDKAFVMLNFDSLESCRSLSLSPRRLQEVQPRPGWALMLSEHTAASITAQVSLLVLEETQRSPGVRQTQRKEEASLQNTQPLQSLQRRWTRKTTIYTRHYKGPGEKEKREQKDEAVSLHNKVGTALQLCNFKPFGIEEFSLFSNLYLHVICRWDFHILHSNVLVNYTSNSTLFTTHNTQVYPQAQLQLIPELFLAHHQAAVTIMNDNSKDTIALSFWQELWKPQKLIITNANPRKEGNMLSLSSSLTGASTYDNIHRSLENFL